MPNAAQPYAARPKRPSVRGAVHRRRGWHLARVWPSAEIAEKAVWDDLHRSLTAIMFDCHAPGGGAVCEKEGRTEKETKR